MFEEYHSTIKKSENVFRIRKASFGGRPTIYALNNWLEPKDVNVPKIRLKTFRRRVYGISNADDYLQAQGITMNRKRISDWLKDPNNKYEVYKWVVRRINNDRDNSIYDNFDSRRIPRTSRKM